MCLRFSRFQILVCRARGLGLMSSWFIVSTWFRIWNSICTTKSHSAPGRSAFAPTHSRPLLTLYECVCDLTTATCIAKLASALLSYLLISIKKVICVPIVYPPDVRPDLAFLGGRAKSAPKIWVREAHTQAGPLLYQRF